MEKMFSFYGRARPKEYWCTLLVLCALGIVASVAIVTLGIASLALGAVSFLESLPPGGDQFTAQMSPAFIISALLFAGFLVIVTWIWLAVTARRLRDAGWSPWLAIIVILQGFGGQVFGSLLALVSLVALIVFGCIKSKT